MTGYRFSSFYSVSQAIENARDPAEKLRLCEVGLELLPAFVAACIDQDGELPPVIICRDVAPWLYMKQGKWDDAERVIQFCISCGAYYPKSGKAVLNSFEAYRDAACVAMAFIKNHPGVLQKDVYKKLTAVVSSDEMREVMRSFELIHKEKEGKTNRLQIIE